MHSNINCNPGDSAGIVDTAFALNQKAVGSSPPNGSSFHTFIRPGLNIAQNIITDMFLLLLFLLFFHHVTSK